MSVSDPTVRTTRDTAMGSTATDRPGSIGGSAPDHSIEGAIADLQAQLQDLEVRYRGIIHELPAVIYLVGLGPGGHVIDVSPGVSALLGVTREDLLASPDAWFERVHPDDRDRIAAANDHAIETGEPFRVEYRAVHRDGREVWIKDDCVVIRDEHGTPMYRLGLMLDVTDDAATRDELHEARSKYGALVEQIPAIVYVDVADDQMTTTYVSPQIYPLLGCTPEEYVSDPDLWARMLHADDREAAIETYLRGRELGQPFVYEYRLVAKDGRVLWFRDSAIVLTDADGRPTLIQGVMLDITERKAAEEQIAYLAYHDKLTGMANRTMFDELLELSLTRARRNGGGVAVISVDIDDFKLVNDSLGHERGDELITALADRLREATRDTDLVARPGGDEFLVLLADLDTSAPVPGGQNGGSITAEAVAMRVQEAMRQPFEVAGTELYLTASQGISVFPEDAHDMTTLLTNAETAMFQSKRMGPGGFVVHSTDTGDAMTRLSMSTRLRKAVEQKQWMLHYQPLIELDSGRMYGVEALIRWPGPNGGLVPPGEFIPLAEEMGLIEAIGDWVVEEICRQDAQWRAEGLELEIGFNLSPRQLWQPELVAKVAAPIIVAGMDPARVTVEITESTAMTDPDRTIELLYAMHDRGLKLAIDDFGTGYSSLARLKHMPVDILKIDRSFVRDVDLDRDAASMVSAMISLAHNLGMTPLAEGIETEGEWRFLADRGCPLGQGYFFSRPVPASDILAMHRRESMRALEGGN
ncbi:MAG TPA: EAL domain-containing protein [Actinomycetota bacterium]|nr:EAL domain-containing protein [Actinomycetota bacterium]